MKGNVIYSCHVSNTSQNQRQLTDRRVVTLLTASLALRCFSRNLNNRLVPWVYWTWFVLQVRKQLGVSCLDELTCLHNTADAAQTGYNMCQALLGLQAKSLLS